jgi:LacI family transcriptional regulator
VGRVTIQDLADKLGLSKFSVSRALSGKPGVSEATRNRVLRTAHAMGYRLGQEQSPAAGHILFIRHEIDPVTSELWLNVLHGAEREGERLGYAIVPRQTRYFGDGSQLDPNIVGIILAMPNPDEIADAAVRTGRPVVSVNYVRPFEPVDQIVCADWEGGMAVAERLVGLGHRAFAFVRGQASPAGRPERFRGFRDGVSATAGVKLDDLVFEQASGFRAPFLAYVERGGAPTAMFCADDGIAVTVISELLRLGIRVPEDISVVGFNDLAVATQVSPRLTTVRTPMVAMGTMAVRCIADRLDRADHAAPPLRLAITGQIVERESTGPAAACHWPAALLKRAREPV